MKFVQFFSEDNEENLQEEINEWILENDVVVLDIKPYGYGFGYMNPIGSTFHTHVHSAVVIYEAEIPIEEDY